MKEIKMYKCDKCGTVYDDKKDAEICEGLHHKAVKIIECKFTKGGLTPKSIMVKLDNDEVMEFVYKPPTTYVDNSRYFI